MATPSSILHPSPPGAAPEKDPLYLTVRFSASIPDLRLDIDYPETTTAAGLKQAIRARLPQSLSSHRLRLIYAGRGLEDTTPLAVSLKLPPPPTTRFSKSVPSTENDATSDQQSSNIRDKGKAPVREPPRLYVHCSIGDIILSAADLAAEAAVASTLHKEADEPAQSKTGRAPNNQPHDQPSSSTIPAPRGFDRLLSAGFTASEVTSLRSQFMAILSTSRTPDTMPSGAELRELEDRWLDEGSSAMGAGGAIGGGEGASFADDDGGFGTSSRGAIDDMLWGAVMGFFWPVGCAMWLRREEGVWSWRKGLAVFVGVVVNIAFGAMRIMN
ncbi:DSC3 family protein [Aspergillus undulatus]|uniref:DSC3 family protein n=1 Tax=Aspergillus undulatus TaxID=1810928 RepID=UPI003CCD7E2C